MYNSDVSNAHDFSERRWCLKTAHSHIPEDWTLFPLIIQIRVLKGIFCAKNVSAKHETNPFLHYFLLPFPSKTRPPNSNEMGQNGESDLSREYSIITEISECVPNFKTVPYVICQSRTLKLCLFHGTTVHKRNRIHLPSGVSTYLYALPSACYFIYDFVTLVVYQFQGLSIWTAD